MEVRRSTARAAHGETTRPTLRDKSMQYRVRPFIGNYLLVEKKAAEGETKSAYRVEASWLAGDVDARCQCPVRVYRKERCQHELAAIRYERVRVAQAQGF